MGDWADGVRSPLMDRFGWTWEQVADIPDGLLQAFFDV